VSFADDVSGHRCLISIDADFFTMPSEQRLAEQLEVWFAQVARQTPVIIRENHVDLVDLVEPVDLVVNFDFHMDLRLEFLHGAPACSPPQDATVFESILATSRAGRYVWAHPESRRADAATAYASACLAGSQPLLQRIHCLPGTAVLTDVLPRVRPAAVFVCRSPAYATEQTDAVFERLRLAASGGVPSV
jgi:hypothetical protein